MDRPAITNSYRSAVYATRGMCATSQPLATLAGVEILKQGGSAADAAISMLATLAVVEPHMNGLGGDMFGLYFESGKNKLVGLNSSGPSPASLNLDLVLSKGYTTMPVYGPLPITVPGALAGLSVFYERFGKLSWEDLFQKAIEYAETGFPLSEIISYEWHCETILLKQCKETAALYLPNERAPKTGEIFINKPLARTLRKVAREGITTFYRGEIGENICQAMSACGCPLSMEDLSNFSPDWVEPVSIDYKGRKVFELPPNCQGITVLEMLSLLDGFNLEAMGHNTSEYIHTMVEAKKFAFFDRDTKLGDPRFTEQNVHNLISAQNAQRFRNQFDPSRQSSFCHTDLPSDTVYVVAVDENRNIASFISSIFESFGSGIVAGDTGILMQNRGSSFTLDEDHPNGLKPGKRPLHTIIPAMVFKDQKPEFAFGVMGGHMQPQGHVQILNNLYIFGLGIQEVSDQPRFFHDGKALCLESGIPHKVKRELIDRGHKIHHQIGVFGGYQGIWLDRADGKLIGGSDLRKDGCAIGY